MLMWVNGCNSHKIICVTSFLQRNYKNDMYEPCVVKRQCRMTFGLHSVKYGI